MWIEYWTTTRRIRTTHKNMPSVCTFTLNHPNAVYYSGQTINGTISLTTTSEKNIRSKDALFLDLNPHFIVIPYRCSHYIPGRGQSKVGGVNNDDRFQWQQHDQYNILQISWSVYQQRDHCPWWGHLAGGRAHLYIYNCFASRLSHFLWGKIWSHSLWNFTEIRSCSAFW